MAKGQSSYALKESAQALKGWYHNQSKFRTQKELASHLGMPLQTLKKYFFGYRMPGLLNRRKIFQLTNLKEFHGNGDVFKLSAKVNLPHQIESFKKELAQIIGIMEWFYFSERKSRESLRSQLGKELFRFQRLVRALSSERAKMEVDGEGGILP